ncbi:polysaccharide deacetylase family protein [Paenibacillus daejeonensis]|uniref:polysaccharide deacetylase family protein n=1 Tax=Paenibacillus daejeonensis TaxID=135193 RepID=UPI001B7F9394|nr:polysaccharide deacetylase family protein [Paenibacillus daejeonensis]
MLHTLLWALAIVGACYLLSLILPWEAISALTERPAASDQAALAGAVLSAGVPQQPTTGTKPDGMASGPGDELAPAAPPSGNAGPDGTGVAVPEDPSEEGSPGNEAEAPPSEPDGSVESPVSEEGGDAEAPPADTTGSTQPPAAEQPVPPVTETPAGESAAGDRKLVALTFDDGPDIRYTPQVLEILKQYGVKATFFVVGTQIEKYPAVLQQMKDEGHTIGNHTYAHANLPKLEGQALIDEIEKGDELIKDVLGETTRYFRAPYGAVSDPLKALLRETGRELVGWTVDTRDWAGTEPDEILKIVQETVRPNGIILMHSFGGRKGSLQNTIDALPAVIEYLQNEGYTLVPMSELSPNL